MKTRVLLALCMAMGFWASAQMNIGIRLGAGLSNLEVENFEGDATWQEVKSGRLQPTFHGGLYAQIKLGNFFFQPELLYAQLRQEAEAQQSSTGGNSGAALTVPLEFQRLEVPLLLGTELGPVRLMLGPSFSIMLEDRTGNFDEDLQTGTFGYQAGIGARVGNLSIDLRYESQLSKTASQILVDNTEYQADFRGSQFLLCLGFALF